MDYDIPEQCENKLDTSKEYFRGVFDLYDGGEIVVWVEYDNLGFDKTCFYIDE